MELLAMPGLPNVAVLEPKLSDIAVMAALAV